MQRPGDQQGKVPHCLVSYRRKRRGRSVSERRIAERIVNARPWTQEDQQTGSAVSKSEHTASWSQ